ncbi:MAG: VanZ family protein [Cyanobacteria bacterium]|nr:VanZ family protein [Cyanobacteria bacterium GSL.Bin21]
MRKHYFPRAKVIAIGSALLIALVTLFPFNFTWQVGISLGNLFRYFHHPSNSADFIGNILLFMPLSVGLTDWLRHRRMSGWAGVMIVVFLSFGLSLTVEVLQVFLPSRSPTRSDILANSIGGLVGWLIFQLKRIYRSLSVQGLVILLIGYMVIAMLLLIPNPSASRLSNWETSFPLVIGNEATGDRAWQGKISQFWISDRALTKEEVQQAFSDLQFSEKLGNARLADYKFSGEGSYRDRAGNLPDLIWQGNREPSEVASFNSQQWLETPKPVTVLSQRLRQSSEFSLGITLATSQLNQAGPARIISVSDSPYQRNLTLGQELDELILRLRMPITGENGRNPAIALPNIFSDTDWHQVIITYNFSTQLAFYIDQVSNIKKINLDLPILSSSQFSFLGDKKQLSIDPFLLIINRVLFYAIFLIPLGIILVLLYLKLRFRNILFNQNL